MYVNSTENKHAMFIVHMYVCTMSLVSLNRSEGTFFVDS